MNNLQKITIVFLTKMRVHKKLLMFLFLGIILLGCVLLGIQRVELAFSTYHWFGTPRGPHEFLATALNMSGPWDGGD